MYEIIQIMSTLYFRKQYISLVSLYLKEENEMGTVSVVSIALCYYVIKRFIITPCESMLPL